MCCYSNSLNGLLVPQKDSRSKHKVVCWLPFRYFLLLITLLRLTMTSQLHPISGHHEHFDFHQYSVDQSHLDYLSQQCETIFHISYGWFDANRTWNYDMKSKYVRLQSMMYMDETTDDFEQLEDGVHCSIMRRSKK